MSKVILIAGGQGAGKTALANHLVSVLPNAIRLGFADPMRSLVRGLLATAKEIDLGLPEQIESRSLMQFLGTEFGREIDPLLWVKYAQKKISTLPYDYFIYDDLRFRNEYDAFPDAIHIRLECPAELRQKRAKYWGDPTHVSETDLNVYYLKFDAMFDTSGDMIETHTKIVSWLQNNLFFQLYIS